MYTLDLLYVAKYYLPQVNKKQPRQDHSNLHYSWEDFVDLSAKCNYYCGVIYCLKYEFHYYNSNIIIIKQVILNTSSSYSVYYYSVAGIFFQSSVPSMATFRTAVSTQQLSRQK